VLNKLRIRSLVGRLALLADVAAAVAATSAALPPGIQAAGRAAS
jgi:hypothetical protein